MNPCELRSFDKQQGCWPVRTLSTSTWLISVDGSIWEWFPSKDSLLFMHHDQKKVHAASLVETKYKRSQWEMWLLKEHMNGSVLQRSSMTFGELHLFTFFARVKIQDLFPTFVLILSETQGFFLCRESMQQKCVPSIFDCRSQYVGCHSQHIYPWLPVCFHGPTDVVVAGLKHVSVNIT